VVAKYGDKSVYFDLEDLGNTTGQWDLYGSDAPSPYNPLQVCLLNFRLFYFVLHIHTLVTSEHKEMFINV
jgi:hypothetical protein